MQVLVRLSQVFRQSQTLEQHNMLYDEYTLSAFLESDFTEPYPISGPPALESTNFPHTANIVDSFPPNRLKRNL